MKLMKTDHDRCLRACADPRATETEKIFLSAIASAYAANESISKRDFNRMNSLTGGSLSPDDSIFDRPMPDSKP